LGLLPLVTRAEYSCRTLHKQSGIVSENSSCRKPGTASGFGLVYLYKWWVGQRIMAL
jgi:hypothetical protein